MKNILVFGASNSKSSINKKLAVYAANQLEDVNLTVLDLNDFEMPIFSIDLDAVSGVPQLAKDFKEHICSSDGIIISFAEYNGTYTTAFKNIFDWVSRIEKNMWHDKPMLLMSATPGPMGGKFVLEAAVQRFSHTSEGELTIFSLPSFQDNFVDGEIVNKDLQETFQKALDKFKKSV